MSSSSNLYAADDTDAHSFSDELSPADGYFNHGDVPRHLVQDPSIDYKPEPKTLIAPPQQSSTGGTSRSSLHSLLPRSPSAQHYASPQLQLNTSNSHVSFDSPSSIASSPTEDMFLEITTPLTSGPPPAYSPSPAPPSLPQEAPEQRYSTIPEEERGFLAHREPESMGGPIEGPDERTPLSVSRRRESPFRKMTKTIRKAIKKTLLAALLIVVALTLLLHFFMNRSSNRELLPIHDRPIDAEGPYCSIARYRNDEVAYEFPVGSDLSVIQTTHNNEQWGNAQVSTVGEIRLRRIPQDSQHGNKPYFTVEAHVSDPELEVVKTWDKDAGLLKVSTPRYAQLARTGQHCISLEITAWFPEEAQFTNVLAESVTLTLRVIDDIKVAVSGRSKFTTVSGNIWFPSVDDDTFYTMHSQINSQNSRSYIDPSSNSSISALSSRRIVVETVSGSINGAYPLEDLLSLSTQSGNIDVRVLPKPVDKSAPEPADFEIQSSSGSIKALLPVRNADYPNFTPPPRNYVTNVHSTAGNVDGSYYLGSESNFKTTSGSIRITALPVLQSGESDSKDVAKNIFETHTLSGLTEIDVQEPVFISPLPPSIGDADPYLIIPSPNEQNLFTLDSRASSLKSEEKIKLHSLKSSHTSNAAGVKVHYPDVWEGTIHAKTMSGTVSLVGSGIRFIQHKKGPARTDVLARRGVQEKGEGSLVDMSSLAGTLHMRIA